MDRKQLIALLLAVLVSVGGVVAHGAALKPSAVDEPAEKYFDPATPLDQCQDCIEEEEQNCQPAPDGDPCMCVATSGSQITQNVHAHQLDGDECVPLYRINR